MSPSAPEGLTLRERPRPADRNEVARVLRATAFFREEEVAIAVELVDEAVAKGEASGYSFLFADRADGTLAGYACYGLVPLTAASYDLYWIGVDPVEQRRGLGRWLLAECEGRIAALGGAQVWVETSGREQYEPTRAFYERSGYRVAGRFADFYAPGDDKVVFVRRVKGEE